MIISKQAGHYKLVNRLFEPWNISRSLCGYFWQFVLSLSLHIVVPTAVFMVPLVVVLGAAESLSPMAAMLLLTGVVIWILGAIGLASIIVGLIQDHVVPHVLSWFPERKKSEPSEPSIVWAYLKAKKSKVCPLIVFD